MWYGPDTYMGRNLAELFTSLSQLSDEEVAKVHPAHTAASVKALLPRLHHYTDGTCIVHHIFGGETCNMVKQVRWAVWLLAVCAILWAATHAVTLCCQGSRLQVAGLLSPSASSHDCVHLFAVAVLFPASHMLSPPLTWQQAV